MKKWLLPPVILLCLLILAAMFAISTETGLRIIRGLVNNNTGGVVYIESVTGRLGSSYTLHGVKINLPGLHVGVDDFSFGWNPVALLGGTVESSALVVNGVQLDFLSSGTADPEPSQESAFSLPDILLPLRLDFDKVDVNSISFLSSGSEVFRIDRVGGKIASGLSNVSVHDFYLYSPDIDLNLHGNIALAKEWNVDLQGSYRFVGYGFHELHGTFAATKSLKSPHVEFSVNSPGDIRVSGDVTDLFTDFSFTALLDAKETDLSKLIVHCPEILLHAVKGDIHGNLDGYGGIVSADGTWGVMDKLQLNAEITADWWGIVFDKLQITQNDGVAIAQNSWISWKNLFDWEGDFEVKSFDPEPLSKVMTGRLSADFHSVGKVRDDGLLATFAIGKIGGVLNERPVSGEGTMNLTEAGISTDNFVLTSGEMAGTATVLNASFSWEDDLPWFVDVMLDKFDPSGLYLGLDGDINGRVAVQGAWPDERLHAKLSLQDLHGNVRGLPLDGSGELDLLGETVLTTGLQVHLGSAALKVQGSAGNDLAVGFSVDIPELNIFNGDWRGKLQAAGSLSGNVDEPNLSASFTGNKLAIGENSINRLDGKALLGGTEQIDIQVSAEASGAVLAGYGVDTAQFSIEGTREKHKAMLAGTGDFGSLKAIASGGYDTEWHGDIVDFHLDSPHGSWHQGAPTGLIVGVDHAALQRFCLENGDSSVCLGGRYALPDDGAINWQGWGRMNRVSLAWLNHAHLLSVPINGNVDGKIEGSGAGQELHLIKGSLVLGKAAVELDLGDDGGGRLVFDDAKIDFDLNDGLLLAEAHTHIHDDGAIGIVARVNGMHSIGSSLTALPVSGSIELEHFDISLLSSFSGNYLQPTGRLTNEILVGGTIGKPEFQGKLNVEGGGIFLPYQGITLEDLDLGMQAEEDGAQITCSAISGPGKITAQGMIKWNSGLEGSFAVTGKDFLLVNLPEYSIRVDPALHFRFSGADASVSGSVLVPYGRITPEEMTSSVSVSKDVIFVNGDEEEDGNKWPVDLNIRVNLGEDVRVDGYGLTGQVVGNLDLKTSVDHALVGEGEITLKDSAFSLYGRKFDIVRGRLLFSGGAIDNPGVDVRAQKKVSDEEAKGTGYTVGVDISGLVQDLQYHLFSDPYMEETEIVSRMLIGTSLSEATPEEGGLLEAALVTLGVQGSGSFVKGIGSLLTLDDLHLEGSSSKEDVSLVVGKRLTEDLYIGYDVNMFSRLGQFRVRYDLTHGFAVETKSSSESTGADLLYSIER